MAALLRLSVRQETLLWKWHDADVHMLLGDVGLETERFESAKVDYEQALGLLQAKLQVPPSSTSQMLTMRLKGSICMC